jgi:hypothetical protein
MGFLKDGLSINEAKVSTLALAFLVTLGFALWQFATEGFIDGGMLTLLAYEIGAITGINVIDKFTNRNNVVNTNYDNTYDSNVGG